ncbi:hypothetical protein KHO57_gp013 [Mycobacterium phage Phabba]|uniref:Uncharacterized protein n=1 Tax=Mycobacterium phage Phabba TaxID=2027899 RepID=A0A249XS90_9CAUD|nr:hypothetical protein KHO57_gp013 [Mycobacterium phage Phabba]ASZ74588.1 hypothetical protein SEA_PHABBA_13 [Mycobacterium phage Phabba]
MSTTTDYNVATMTPAKRASIRAELTEQHDYLTTRADNYSTSNEVILQFLDTAIHATDAVDRVAALADALAPLDDTSPLGEIGFAIATQIRNALKGI